MGVPDNGPLIVGVTWFLTVFCGGFLALRIYAKLSRLQGLWWDDHILIVSWVLLLANAVMTQIGTSLGFGKHTADIPVQNLITIALGTSAATTISSFASTFSKISFGLTLLRLTNGKLRWFVWYCIITLFLVMLPSSLFAWIACRPLKKQFDPNIPGTCWPAQILVNYGIFNAAYCAAADFALALLPWYLIWGLQLKTKEKLGVGIAMSLGVLSGVCAIVKGIYIVQLLEKDFYYNGKDVTVWTEIEIATAIVAASIPVLRVFLKEAVSSYNRSHPASNSKGTPLSRLNRSQQSHITTIVHAKGKNGEWTTIKDNMEDGSGDGASQRSILRDEELGLARNCHSGNGVVEHRGILQTSTVTVTVDEDDVSHKGKSWLGAPSN